MSVSLMPSKVALEKIKITISKYGSIFYGHRPTLIYRVCSLVTSGNCYPLDVASKEGLVRKMALLPYGKIGIHEESDEGLKLSFGELLPHTGDCAYINFSSSDDILKSLFFSIYIYSFETQDTLKMYLLFLNYKNP